MELPVRKFKSMAVALKELEVCFKNKDVVLQTGKPFQNFGKMLPREAVANWLLCATANAIDGRQLSFVTAPDLVGGDGVIQDEKTGEVFPTEHVMVPTERSGGDAQALILKAINDKRNKGGAAYDAGMTLVVFVNADSGQWFPNRVARSLPDPLHFAAVWVVSLQKVEDDGTYLYAVTHLDVSKGDAPAFHVRISKDFDAWTVRALQ